MSVLAQIAAFIGVGLLFGFAAYASVRDYRDVTAIDRAWRHFAHARGFEFTPHSGPVWLHTSFGKIPHLRGVIDGVSFDLVPSKSFEPRALHPASRNDMSYSPLTWTLAFAPIANARAGPLIGPELRPDAASTWASLKQARPSAKLEIGPAVGGGHAVIVGWLALERDPDVLASALRLIAAVAKTPPHPHEPPPPAAR
jgi:hypothetical protein